MCGVWKIYRGYGGWKFSGEHAIQDTLQFNTDTLHILHWIGSWCGIFFGMVKCTIHWGLSTL